MRPSLILWALLCLYVIPLHSQYVISPIPPAPNFTFNDLWHFTVVRSAADDNSQFYITLRIFDSNNTLKVKSNTANLSLPAGSHYYNLSNISELQPLVTSYYDASVLQQSISSGGIFPPGIYNVTYTLYGKAADGEFAPLTENTSEVVVEAMWPPMLLSPPDGDSIDTQYPTLIWTPAFSSVYNGQITYTLNLVELYTGQNAYQAIQSNPLYFSQNNIPSSLLIYPPSAQILDTTKVYAWQVHADGQGTAMGSSEVWTFTWKKSKQKQVPLIKSYYKLADKMAVEFVYIKTPFLPIVTEERYNPSGNSSLRFKILTEKMVVVGNQTNFDEVIKAGFNKYLIPICSSEGNISLDSGKYYLVVELEKGKKSYLPFEIKQGNCHE